MIFSIDPSIKSLSQSEILKFSDCIVRASENHHHISMTPQEYQWFETKILNSNKYFGELIKEMLRSNNELFSMTSMQAKYLRTVIIGMSKNLSSVDDMKILAEEPSVIVLENGKNDWTVLRKWIELYRKRKLFGNINLELHRAVTSGRIRQYNAGGGSGSISNAINVLIPIYKDLHILKITTVFDSDKKSATDTCHNSSLIAFLNEKGFEWHELQKREIENYFPFSVYEKSGLLVQGISIPNMSHNDLDFCDMSNQSFINMQKSDVEKLALNLTRSELEERVSYDLNAAGIDEVQEIILKIAKFI